MNNKISSRRNFLKLLSLTSLGLSFIHYGCSDIKMDNRPNIILIMADDIGFSDIGCYGSEINTPNLDKLGENGIRFKQFYNMAKCNPTRVSVLTGMYQGDSTTLSIGQLMRNAGYTIIWCGKEHFDN